MVRHVGQISINVFVRYSRLVGVSPFFFFPFYLPLIPLPPPPPIPSLFFLITIARSVLFVATMHNGARAAHVCLSSGGILIANRDYRAERLLRVYFQRPRISTPRFSSGRARPPGEEGREGERETKNGEIETPRFTRRSRRDARAVEARGCDSRNTSGTRAYPVTVSFVPATICYFVHIHNAVTSSRTDAFSPPPLFPSLFFPSLFPPARTRTRLAPVTVHRYPRSA